MEPGIRPLSR